MTGSGTGLREIKKQLTREAIADAAYQLVLDKGLENVTIDEIAQLAFISPRTFSNYFSCKEEAVVAAGSPVFSGILEALDERPTDEPPLHSLGELVVDAVRDRTDEQLAVTAGKLRLSQRYPAMQPYEAARYDAFETAIGERIAARTGTELATDLYPGLVAAVVTGALRVAVASWVHADAPRERLPELLTEAFQELADGLPLPAASR
ncbi:TetR family transcriptional regulator [Desertihabitans brevis]|uniref:TetR family transcriptional regulator n=1 Tax=Desertihabitans brevis TaxID=2268447 RepID=A0A367YTX4_9ACTN|nr:TetR family transcriptional regulator [Desertihabitans brevis]RCK69304.1 TetR family transcriptional regulator [Desertihabitans brevis]